ncbi:putative peptidyl-prolyl cis-trans isomerase [uncultured Pleomorphomonas sp.]|uniref:Parvulin-like PPIase n=1 Tax=uncultured Pleomorphomonas sp. TaxID=442121 RepID=A0A212LG23_9HYPH|nr:peptidylprolyl isomerase [uncultured Pleomorphomonas sp.]SCM76417.1 putative peptidyl-prolyl cis-trans isomerase [uncultured Pleomorphomonas sp.]
MVAIDVDHRRNQAAQPATADTAGRKEPRGSRPTVPRITVDGVAIERKAIAAEMQNHPGEDAAEALREAATALIVREVLLGEARRLGIVAEPETDAEGRRETEEDALIRGLVAAAVSVPSADEETLRRYYDNNRRRFVTPALYAASHILFAARRDAEGAFTTARDKAATVREQLVRQPHRFAELAQGLSDCPSAKVGGSLGQISPGETTPEFEAALASLSPGELSNPVETRYGVHLIRLDRKIDGEMLPFEVVRDRIADYLAERVRRRASAQYISQLIGRAHIDGFELAGSALPLVQ